MENLQERIKAFIDQHINKAGIEIEAKLGTFIRTPGTDLEPYTILPKNLGRFESAVSAEQFLLLEEILRGSPDTMRVSETRTKDTTFNRKGKKIRKSYDKLTREETFDCKTTLTHMNILINPQSGFGVRISANVKEPCAPARPSGYLHFRHKDRTCYEYQTFHYDLTLVGREPIYEVEIELLKPDPNSRDPEERNYTAFIDEVLGRYERSSEIIRNYNSES